MGEHRCLITGPGAELEHDVVFSDAQQVRHDRDDEWLRDRLAGADRQRAVGISLGFEAVENEFVAWHGAHCPEHLRRHATPGQSGTWLTRILLDDAHHLRALGGIIGPGRRRWTG